MGTVCLYLPCFLHSSAVGEIAWVDVITRVFSTISMQFSLSEFRKSWNKIHMQYRAEVRATKINTKISVYLLKHNTRLHSKFVDFSTCKRALERSCELDCVRTCSLKSLEVYSFHVSCPYSFDQIESLTKV